jgi:hypothetical protein
MKYDLRIYKPNSTKQFEMWFAMGMCTFTVCEDDSLNQFDTFYIQTAMDDLKSNFTLELSYDVSAQL